MFGTNASVIIQDPHKMVCGKLNSCEIDMSFGRPTEYRVSFYPDRVEGGKSWTGGVLDLTENCVGKIPKAKKVIYNPPATIVLWEDGTKTVVKCDSDDMFDDMKGLALCYMKKALGNTSRELNKALRKGKNDASV